MITTKEIIQAISGITVSDNNLMVTEAVIDSRKAIPGSLFIALAGEQTDGHRYVKSAFEKGAQIALVQQDVAADIRMIDLRHFDKTKIDRPSRIPLLHSRGRFSHCLAGYRPILAE